MAGSSELGICPNCDQAAAVGSPCGTAGCLKRAYHAVPTEHAKGDGGPLDPMVGRMVGDYLVVGVLGSGGFGTVFRALQLPIGLPAALKLLHADRVSADTADVMLRKFEAEARALARLTHPNIVRLLKYGETDGAPYLVMELVEGAVTLRDHLDRSGGSLPPSEVGDVLGRVLDGLGAAHAAGVVHRDVKPANIMLQPLSEGGFQVRILDFGLAKLTDGGNLQNSIVAGTPAYMAPEQALGRTVGPAADLYAVGAMAFEALTGCQPFAGRTPHEIGLQKSDPDYDPVSRVGSGLFPLAGRTLLSRALAIDPAERYASASEFKAELQGIVAQWPALPRPASRGPADGHASTDWVGPAADQPDTQTQSPPTPPEEPSTLRWTWLGALAVGVALIVAVWPEGDEPETMPAPNSAASAPTPPLRSAPEPSPQPQPELSPRHPDDRWRSLPRRAPAAHLDRSDCTGWREYPCRAAADRAYRAGRFLEAAELTHRAPHPYDTIRDVYVNAAGVTLEWGATRGTDEVDQLFWAGDRGRGAVREAALERLTRRCGAGDGRACTRAGMVAARLERVALARAHYRRGHELGAAGATGLYGYLLREDDGKPAEGRPLLISACSDGDLMACEDHWSTLPSGDKAAAARAGRELSAACVGGHAVACAWLAEIAKAADQPDSRWPALERACLGGVGWACARLAKLDERDAPRWLTEGCSLDHLESCVTLARSFKPPMRRLNASCTLDPLPDCPVCPEGDCSEPERIFERAQRGELPWLEAADRLNFRASARGVGGIAYALGAAALVRAGCFAEGFARFRKLGKPDLADRDPWVWPQLYLAANWALDTTVPAVVRRHYFVPTPDTATRVLYARLPQEDTVQRVEYAYWTAIAPIMTLAQIVRLDRILIGSRRGVARLEAGPLDAWLPPAVSHSVSRLVVGWPPKWPPDLASVQRPDKPLKLPVRLAQMGAGDHNLSKTAQKVNPVMTRVYERIWEHHPTLIADYNRAMESRDAGRRRSLASRLLRLRLDCPEMISGLKNRAAAQTICWNFTRKLEKAVAQPTMGAMPYPNPHPGQCTDLAAQGDAARKRTTR